MTSTLAASLMSTTSEHVLSRPLKSKSSKKATFVPSSRSSNGSVVRGGVSKQKHKVSTSLTLTENHDFGCPHLNVPKSSPIWPNFSLFRKYKSVIRQGEPWNNSSIPLPPFPSCKECSDSRRILFCLHCRWSSCWKSLHIHQHFKDSEQCTFAFDIDHGHVFCSLCNDYVYDERFSSMYSISH
ncbi:Ubiquitin carboxyl-terminal hydrolase 51 [Coelomomyces lativittatus]|nr:Ubiquitin carboxyl-terminal hydrolase 51 [Coelomomyces lativittatus]